MLQKFEVGSATRVRNATNEPVDTVFPCPKECPHLKKCTENNVLSKLDGVVFSIKNIVTWNLMEKGIPLFQENKIACGENEDIVLYDPNLKIETKKPHPPGQEAKDSM